MYEHKRACSERTKALPPYRTAVAAVPPSYLRIHLYWERKEKRMELPDEPYRFLCRIYEWLRFFFFRWSLCVNTAHVCVWWHNIRCV